MDLSIIEKLTKVIQGAAKCMKCIESNEKYQCLIGKTGNLDRYY